MNSHHSERQLKKNVGIFLAMTIVIGTVIGSGIFMKPGKVIAYAGDSTMALWAWVVGGIITLASGLTIAEVGTQIPKTGGLYIYLEEVYGKTWGFLSGWVQTIIYGPAIIGSLGLFFGSLMANLFGIDHSWETAIAIITVLFLTVVNCIGTKYGGFVQNVATVGKLVPIVLIAFFGIWKGNGQILDITSGLSTGTSFGAAVLATLFAYDGWMLITNLTGEMKNPAKTLPIAVIGGILVVILSYLSVNVALLHLLPANKIVALGENTAGTAASLLFGNIGGKLISVGILVSIFGCLNGKLLSMTRVPFAMAERGHLPASKLIASIHPTFQTPVYAIWLEVLIAIVMMLGFSPDRLTEISVFSVYIFYILAFFAVFILRKRNANLPRSYSVPLFPVVPLIAIVGSGYIVISTIMITPVDSLSAIGLTLIGLPMFWYLERKGKKDSSYAVSK